MSDMYPYADGERLEDRNTYFYSSYYGQEFFHEYYALRIIALKMLGEPKKCKIVEAAGIEGLSDDGIDTKALIKSLLGLYMRDKNGFEHWSFVNHFVQRFEVAKRVYPKYGINWRPTNKNDYKELSLYLLFAELMVRAYQYSAKLPYLNALLKVVDTLISTLESLEVEQKQHLAYILEKELGYVEALAEPVRIK